MAEEVHSLPTPEYYRWLISAVGLLIFSTGLIVLSGILFVACGPASDGLGSISCTYPFSGSAIAVLVLGLVLLTVLPYLLW